MRSLSYFLREVFVLNNVKELIDSGILKTNKIHYNLPVEELIKIAVEKEGGVIAKNGLYV